MKALQLWNHHRHWHIWLALFCLLGLSGVLAQALPGSSITNTATATYSIGGVDNVPESTNTLETVIPETCEFRVEPNGTRANPGQFQTAMPGDEVTFRYELDHIANTSNSFFFAAEALRPDVGAPADVQLEDLRVVIDSNGNGIADEAEVVAFAPELARSAELNVGQSLSILVIFKVPEQVPEAMNFYINLRAGCERNAGFSDTNNVAQVEVLEGGLENLTKAANPATGSTVEPATEINYSISFNSIDADVRNVTVTDVIDPNVELLSFSTGSISDPDSGLSTSVLANYDEATRTLVWRFDRIPAGMTVTLNVTVQVLPGVAANTRIENTATLDYDGSDGPTGSDTTSHPVAGVCGWSAEAPDVTAFEALPGDQVVIPYSLTNTGNDRFNYDVAALTFAGDFDYQAQLFWDENANTSFDASDPEVTQVSLDQGESTLLFLVLTVDDNYDISGLIEVGLSVACEGNPPEEVTSVFVDVPEGGYTLDKEADPETGALVFPGQEITYTITLTAGSRDLENVVITDVLDVSLEPNPDPTATPPAVDYPIITDGLVEDDDQRVEVVGSFDEASRTVMWMIDTVPAGMSVSLSITSAVHSDLFKEFYEDDTITTIPTIAIDNVACATVLGAGDACSDEVSHEVEPIELTLDKTANPNQVTIGDELEYTLSATNTSDVAPLVRPMLVDDLPLGLRYIVGSTQITLPDGSIVTQEPVVEEVDGRERLTWDLPTMVPGDTIIVVFVVLVEPEVLNNDNNELINEAQFIAEDSVGQSINAVADSAVTPIDLAYFKSNAILMGTMYIDMDDDGDFDVTIDRPIEGVRLYLSSGISTISDSFGRYTFLNMDAGLESVRVDMTTVPPRLLQATRSQDSSGLWRVRLQQGLVSTLDVPFVAPEVEVSQLQSLISQRGPIKVVKTAVLNETFVEIILEISSSESLADVIITDPLPLVDEGRLEPVMMPEISRLTDAGVELRLGDISAGYSRTFSYQLPQEDAALGLITPIIEWRLR